MGVLHYIDLTIHPIDPFLKWRSLYDSIKMACSRKKEGMKRSQIQNPPCVLCLVWMCVFMFVCVRMFVCMCLCVCVCLCLCLFVCVLWKTGRPARCGEEEERKSWWSSIHQQESCTAHFQPGTASRLGFAAEERVHFRLKRLLGDWRMGTYFVNWQVWHSTFTFQAQDGLQ